MNRSYEQMKQRARVIGFRQGLLGSLHQQSWGNPTRRRRVEILRYKLHVEFHAMKTAEPIFAEKLTEAWTFGIDDYLYRAQVAA